MNSISTPTSRIQNIANTVLAYFYKIRESIIVVVAVALGILLAVGLYSPNRELTVALAGTSVYIVAIMIDPLKGILLWLVTQPLLEHYLNISLGAGIPDLSLTRLCIALISVLLLARTAIRYQRLQPINRFDIVALCFLVGITQSAPRGSFGIIGSIQNIFDLYWVPVLVYFVIKNLVTSRQSAFLVLYAVLFIALYSAVYAFYESMTGNVLFAQGTHRDAVTIYVDSGLRILRGIWGSNVDFGRIFNLAIPILFYFYLKTSSPTKKAILIFFLVLIFGGLYLTYKRTAWIAMVALMFVMQIFYPQFRRLFIALFVIFTLVTVLNWDAISTSEVYTNRINSQYSTSEGRTRAWDKAIEFWTERPLFGHGYRQYNNLARADGTRFDAVQSEYHNILVSAGLAGFLPYVGMLLMMLYDSFQLYRGRIEKSPIDRDLSAVFISIWVGYVIQLSTTITTNLIVFSLFFAIGGALVYSRRFPEANMKQDIPKPRANPNNPFLP